MRKLAGVPGSVADALAALGAKIASNAAAIAANATAIAALGLPVRADAAQSLTALMIAQALANLGITYVIGGSGYINLFRLVILQWGGTTSGTGGSGTWTYPTTFPNGVFRVFGTASAAGSAGVAIAVTSRNISSATYSAYAPSAGVNYNGSIDFFALGF